MAALLSFFQRDSKKRLWSEYESDSCFDDAVDSDHGHYPLPPKRLKLPNHEYPRSDSVKENRESLNSNSDRRYERRIVEKSSYHRRDPLDIDLRANNVNQSKPVSVPLHFRISSSTTDVINVWRRRPPRTRPVVRSRLPFEPLPSLRGMSISNRKDPEYDFQKLLKSLTAEYDREEEVREFNRLAEQIERLNINLTPTQIAEIVDEEKKMKEMVDRMKALNLEVPEDREHHRELTELLQRLSRLTISGGKDDDAGEFDVASDIDDECIDDRDIVMGQRARTRTKGRCTSVSKLKSIVYKCTKFMLSILMIGAPMLYHYIY